MLSALLVNGTRLAVVPVAAASRWHRRHLFNEHFV